MKMKQRRCFFQLHISKATASLRKADLFNTYSCNLTIFQSFHWLTRLQMLRLQIQTNLLLVYLQRRLMNATAMRGLSWCLRKLLIHHLSMDTIQTTKWNQCTRKASPLRLAPKNIKSSLIQYLCSCYYSQEFSRKCTATTVTFNSGYVCIARWCFEVAFLPYLSTKFCYPGD